MEALREKRFFGLAFRAARPLVPGRRTGQRQLMMVDVHEGFGEFFFAMLHVFSHFGAHLQNLGWKCR